MRKDTARLFFLKLGIKCYLFIKCYTGKIIGYLKSIFIFEYYLYLCLKYTFV